MNVSNLAIIKSCERVDDDGNKDEKMCDSVCVSSVSLFAFLTCALLGKDQKSKNFVLNH